MPRRIKLQPHSTPEEIDALLAEAEDEVHAKRLRAIRMAMDGASRQEIADVTGRALSSISEALRLYNQGGPDRLRDKRHENPGKPFLLDESELQLLARAVEQPHPDGRPWNGPKVIRWIQQNLGKSPHRNTGHIYLLRLGYRTVPNRNRPQAPETTTEEDSTQKPPPFASCKQQAAPETSLEIPLYPSDLSDGMWARLAPLLPASSGLTSRRALVNAMFYVLRTGCPWRYLPREYPAVGTVTAWFYDWARSGVWERVVHSLREAYRLRVGRNARPTAGIIDSQSSKTTEKGGLAVMTPARRSMAGSGISLWIRWGFCSRWWCIQRTSRIGTVRVWF